MRYFKVDKELLERRNKKRDYSVSYNDLLDPNKEDERNKMIQFFKDNECILYNSLYANDIDYKIFVGCMEIYKSTGVNYFYDFEYLRVDHSHITIDKGIKNYNKSWDFSKSDMIEEDYLHEYLKEVSKTITLMKFFGIDNLYGTTIEQYIEHYNNAEQEWHEMRTQELNNRILSTEKSFNQMKDKYYNFDDFDNAKFERIYKECIKNIDMSKNIYTLDEAINMNINLDNNKIFIVFLRKNNKVCFIGRTTNLLNYIGVKNKEYNADSVSFYAVNNDYIDDIYIKSLFEFNLAISPATKPANRKYITLTSVKRIYKEIYRINLTHIRKIISKYNVEKFMIGDIVFLDKIELDRATRDYLDLNIR